MLLKAFLLAGATLQAIGDSGETDGGAPTGGVEPRTAGTVSEIYDGSARDLDIVPPSLEEGDIRIDGSLSDEAWANAPVLRGFTQFDPVEDIPASQITEARVFLTGEAIYFGVRAQDDEARGIRATLARRDGFGRSDDYIRIVLDTFDDQRRAFVFQVNPLGVQGDGLWVEGRGGRGDPIDWNPDFYWSSAGRVDADGYSVEIRIPLKSLRFPEAPIQDWGLQLVRKIQRNGFSESWAPITGERANRLAQAGRLRGLTGLQPGRFLEVNPVFTATRQGTWDTDSERFSRGPASSDVGFNVAYGLTTNLVLDATYNPDFSQVEADAGQIAVNERFALYFPEKRPFFLEGTDVFSMPRELIYTRSIGNPVGATKLSGKVGSFSVAYLGAVDQVSSGSDNPVVNLFRVKRDIGGSSSLGLAYTDRTLNGDAFNRVLGVDGRFVLARRYALDVMAAGSADGSPGGESQSGSLLLARFSRSSRALSLSGSFEDVSDDFRARSGFIRRVGVTQMRGRAGYTFRGGPGALLESWGPSLEVQGYWDRDGFWSGQSPLESEVQLNLSASFRGNVGGYLSLSRDSYSFPREDYAGLYLPGGAEGETAGFAPPAALFDGLFSVRGRAWLSRWERARLSLGASWGQTPIFFLGVPADVGRNLSGNLNLTLYPTGSMSASVGLRHVTLLRERDGSRYSSATIPRLEARYPFSRALFARAIGEYASHTRGDLLDPVSGPQILECETSWSPRSRVDAHDFRVEALLGYEPSPGTVVFLGYTREMREDQAFGFREMKTRADGLFLKVGYRFRM